jgi:hypothetical protein
MIDSREISVVVQGPIVRGADREATTSEVLESVRRHLPHAQLILSTWRGEDVSGLAPDELVLSDDPGAVVPNPDFPNRANNVNRQLVSTSQGLKRAMRKYALKLRSDTPLAHAGFAALDRTSAARYRCWRLFREPVLLPRDLSLHPSVVPSLYHAHDCVQFGLTEDLRDLWDSPPAPEPETSRAFCDGARPPLVYNTVEGPCVRLSAEQYYITAFLWRRGIEARLKYVCDCRAAQAARSLLFMANNFAFAGLEAMGIRIPRRILEAPMSRLSAESEAWTRTARRLSHPLGALLFLPMELARVRAKWLHFWVRYELKPRLRARFGRATAAGRGAPRIGGF